MTNLFYLELKKYTVKKLVFIMSIIVLSFLFFTVPVEDLYYKDYYLADVLLSQLPLVSILYCFILSPSYSNDYRVNSYTIISNSKDLMIKTIRVKILVGWLVTSILALLVLTMDIIVSSIGIPLEDIKHRILNSYTYDFILEPNILINIIIWVLSVILFTLASTITLLTISSFFKSYVLSYIVGIIFVNYLFLMDFLSPFLPKFLYIISPIYGFNFSNLNSFRLENMSFFGFIISFLLISVIGPIIQYKNLKRYKDRI